MPHRIAVAILRELLEIRALAALLKGLDPDLLQPPIAGEPGIARNLLEIRKHAPLFARTQPLQQLAETEAGAHMHVRRLEYDFASPRRRDGVLKLYLLATGQIERLRHSFAVETRVRVVVQPAAPIERAFRLHDHAHRLRYANGERGRQLANQLHIRLPPRRSRREEIRRGESDQQEHHDRCQ
ncbi:MAG TPA: hypothetical protein VMF89_27420, partial [Polyangiales bacterium]|nr:hypothetical protein [Polyangiales bacterium]